MKKVNKVKKIDKFTVITSLLCLVPIILGIIYYQQLPENMATQWREQNTVSNTSPKWLTIFGIPVIMAGGNLILNFAAQNDPKKENINDTLSKFVRLIPVIFSWILYPVTIFMNLEHSPINFNIEFIASLMIGIIFIVIGNYMPKSKQSYTMGIKLPWTLDDEDNWTKTHRIGGFLFMMTGFLFVINAVFWHTIWILVLAIVICIGVPIVYSYRLHRKKQNS